MDIEVITDNQNIARMLKLAFTPEQIHHLLETITANYECGSCPLCGEDEVPVDKDDIPIGSDGDVNNATWLEVHDDDCLVTWLEAEQGEK